MKRLIYAEARQHVSPLDPDLCRIIAALAPEHEVRDHAPDTLQGVLAHPGIVYAGSSDQTIYGDPCVNWAFRAWHDAEHACGLFDFTLAGEALACEAQIKRLLQSYPRAPQSWVTIIRAEVIGQAVRYHETGSFPDDQFTFIRQALNLEV